MNETPNAPILSDDACANRLSGLMNKNHRMIASAFGAAVFVAVVNTLIGLTAALAPDILEAFEFGGFGWFYCLFGFVMFAVAAGIHYKSRVCVIIGLVFMVVDTALSDLPALLKDGNIAYFIMRGFILYALIMGLVGAFQYHSYKRRFAGDPNPTIAALFARGRFHVSAGMILYALLAAAALVIGVFSFLQENRTSFDISKWDAYTTSDGRLTLPMPGTPESSTDGGTTSLLSLGRNVSVRVDYSSGDDLFYDLSDSQLEDLLSQALKTPLTGDMEILSGPRTDSLDGARVCVSMDVRDMRTVGRLQAFATDDAVYIVFALVNAGHDDAQALMLLDAFSDAITING